MSWRKGILTILNGETESEELDLTDRNAKREKNITFICPTLAEVVKVYVAGAIGGTYRPLNDGFGNNVTLLSEQAQVQSGISAGAMKLVASVGVGADRVFTISGVAVTPAAR